MTSASVNQNSRYLGQQTFCLKVVVWTNMQITLQSGHSSRALDMVMSLITTALPQQDFLSSDSTRQMWMYKMPTSCVLVKWHANMDAQLHKLQAISETSNYRLYQKYKTSWFYSINMPQNTSLQQHFELQSLETTWLKHAHNSLIKVLRPTQHKTGHFGDVLPSQSLGFVLKNGNKHNMHR